MSQKLGQQHEHGTDSDTESDEEDDLEELPRHALPGREELGGSGRVFVRLDL